MSVIATRKALEKHLATLSPTLATAYESVTFNPVQGTPYQRVQLVPRTPENPTVGDDYYRDIGEFQIFLCYPANQGVADAQARAEVIRTHFKRGTTLTEGAIEVLITRTPQLAGNVIIGNRLIVPVLITYSVEVF